MYRHDYADAAACFSVRKETFPHVKALQGGQMYFEIQVGHERGGRCTLPRYSSTGEARGVFLGGHCSIIQRHKERRDLTVSLSSF